MTTFEVAIRCVALAAWTYAGFFVVGWWLWELLAGDRRALSVWTGAPIAGFAVWSVVAWYWGSHGGLGDIVWWVVAASLLIDGGVAWLRRSRFRVVVWRDLAWYAVTAGVVSGVFLWNHIDTLRVGRLSVGALQISDVANFALGADHLLGVGMSQPGNLVGFSFPGLISQTPGSFEALAFASEVTRRSVLEVSLPTMLLATVLAAFASADLARQMLPSARGIAAVLGIAGAVGSLFVFASSFYPLSQLWAVPLAVALTATILHISMHHDRRTVVSSIGLVAVCLVPLLLTYPHMALIATPMAAGIGVIVAFCAGGLRSALAVIGVVAVGTILCVAVLPSRVVAAIDAARLLSDIAAGFPLPLLTPADVVFSDQFIAYATQPTRVFLFVLEVVAATAVLILAVGFVGSAKRVSAIAAATTTAAVIAGYAFVYQVLGATYQQWKWMSFFLPLFVVGFGSALALLARSLLDRTPTSGRAITRTVAAALGCLIVATAAAMGHRATTKLTVAIPGRPEAEVPWSVVNDDLRSLGSGPAYAGVDGVNIVLGDVWEALWAGYALRDRRVFSATPAGLTTTETQAPWSVERTGIPQRPGTEVRPINATYQLVRARAPAAAKGQRWIAVGCTGIYESDGTTWRPLVRRAGAEYHLRLYPEQRRAGTLAPVLVRGLWHAADALFLEYLGDDTARFVLMHRTDAGTGRGLERGRFLTPGHEFPFTPNEPLDLQAAFDPNIDEVDVTVDGRSVLAAKNRFFLRPELPFGTVVGRDESSQGVGIRVAGSGEAAFSGKIEDLTPTASCRELLDVASAREGQ
jgi:hypothetical protein